MPTQCPALAILALLPCGLVAQNAVTFTSLHRFAGSPTDGSQPGAPLLLVNGALYGTTPFGGSAGDGVVFELKPAGGGAWKETILYNFTGQNGDGNRPLAGLALAANGNLYGTTVLGGSSNAGAIFELKPPSSAGGAWKETVIYSFDGQNSNGSESPRGLTLGKHGEFYGTTEGGGTGSCPVFFNYGCGTVFQLNPPATSGGAWTLTTLYSFTGQNGDGAGPGSGVILDPKGALYGTTMFGGISNYGMVFQLNPPSVAGGAWSETVVHDFTNTGGDGANPYGSLVTGANGALYGTTENGGAVSRGGTVFELTPPASAAGAWTESILYSFKGGASNGLQPVAGLVLTASGNLYGTTNRGGPAKAGTIFQLTPQKTGTWTEKILHFFTNGNDGAHPQAAMIVNAAGTLYGTATQGGDAGNGTVFTVKP